jgi:hypothetical protein
VERIANDFIDQCYSMLPELSKEGLPAA